MVYLAGLVFSKCGIFSTSSFRDPCASSQSDCPRLAVAEAAVANGSTDDAAGCARFLRAVVTNGHQAHWAQGLALFDLGSKVRAEPVQSFWQQDVLIFRGEISVDVALSEIQRRMSSMFYSRVTRVHLI